MVDSLNVGVLVDWAERSRGVFWRDIIAGDLGQVYHEYRIADFLPERGHKARFSFLDDALRTLDVLIVNWDAVNGDPEFGADLAYRWLEHHRRELWQWVATGKLLIIEGQATYHVPDQRAYDALLGRREVIVCGPEDELDPERQKARNGNRATVTRRARASNAVCSGLKHLKPQGVTRTYAEMFPDAGTAPELQHQDWDLLYRGWLRPHVIGGARRFRWSVLAVAREPRLHHRPLMIAARHGKGAIVATTMFLASSRQTSLVKALLTCRAEPSRIPERAPLRQLAFEKLLPTMISLAVFLGIMGLMGPDAGLVGRTIASGGGAVVSFVVSYIALPHIARWIDRWRRERRS